MVNSNSLIDAFVFIKLLFENVTLAVLIRDRLIKENKHDGQENLTLV